MVPKIVSAAVVAVALLIAGCGGSHKSADTATHASTPTDATRPTATAETRPEVPADHAIASGALLTLPDFPTGWEQQDQSAGKSSLTCQAIATARASLSGRATSPQFAKASDDFVDDVVYVYPSASEAQTSFAGLSGATDRLCIGKALGDQLAKAAESSSATKVTFGHPSAGALSISPVGDQSAAGRITIPYTVQGLNPDAVVDLVFVRVDRGIQILSFIGSADAFDPTVEADLTRAAANRLAAQLHVAAPGPPPRPRPPRRRPHLRRPGRRRRRRRPTPPRRRPPRRS